MYLQETLKNETVISEVGWTTLVENNKVNFENL